MKFSKLYGLDVVTLDGFKAGEISGTELDIKNWEVTHLHIELSKFYTKQFCIMDKLGIFLNSGGHALEISAIEGLGLG